MSFKMTSLHEQYVIVNLPDGQEKRILALDPSRVENVEFIEYRPAPVDAVDQCAIDQWLARAAFIEEDLHWLLRLPHDRFWCQLIFDSTLHRCIDSYLREAQRPYDIDLFDTSEHSLLPTVTERLASLHRLFFLVCLRASTHHESATSCIDAKVFGDILYENYVFDIPRLMDICALYGHGGDAALVTKMIGNIFQQQPKYNNDLAKVVPTIQQAFHTLSAKCGQAVDATSDAAPQKVTVAASTAARPQLESIPSAEFDDIVVYLSDIAHTLSAFLKIYPAGANAFWNSENFLPCLASAYESFAASFPAAFRRRVWIDGEQRMALKTLFRRSQVCLLRVFRLVTYHACLRPIVDGATDDGIVADGIEGFLEIMNSVLAEKRFLAHLNVLFPFGGDRAIIQQSTYLVDETRLQYVEDAFVDAASRHGRRPQSMQDEPRPEEEGAEGLERQKDRFEFEAPDVETDSQDVAGVSLESMISAVCDLLPNLGRGFVELCLEEMNYDMERVINALLENNLPPSLQGLEQTLEDAHNTSAAVSSRSASLLAQRQNVFDGDEFDVFSRSDVDVSRVHHGKHSEDHAGDSAMAAAGGLDPEIRARCSAYAFRPVDVDPGDDMDNVWEYDDEYDDTYDSNVVGVTDADSADEMTASRRPFVVPRVLLAGRSNRSAGDQLSNNDDDAGGSDVQSTEQKPPTRDAFLEDPAVLRQRREERYAAQQQQRGARRRGGEGSREVPSSGGDRTSDRPAHDVKGGPRGQGQATEVVRNRAWKEKNKATRVHHNRKDLADRKRRI